LVALVGLLCILASLPDLSFFFSKNRCSCLMRPNRAFFFRVGQVFPFTPLLIGRCCLGLKAFHPTQTQPSLPLKTLLILPVAVLSAVPPRISSLMAPADELAVMCDSRPPPFFPLLPPIVLLFPGLSHLMTFPSQGSSGVGAPKDCLP